MRNAICNIPETIQIKDHGFCSLPYLALLKIEVESDTQSWLSLINNVIMYVGFMDCGFVYGIKKIFKICDSNKRGKINLWKFKSGKFHR